MLKVIFILLLSTLMLNAKSIIMNDVHYSLNSKVINFEFYITEKIDLYDIKGEVLFDNQSFSDITFEVDNNYIANGNEIKIIGKFNYNKELISNLEDYLIKLVYGESTNISKLTIFKAINDDNNLFLDRMLNAFTYYGGQLFINFTPPSSIFLSPNNYKIYFKSDNHNEYFFKYGTSISRSDFIEFKPNMSIYSVKINWVDPITKYETTVFPEKTYELKQSPPIFSTNFSYESVIGSDLILCRVANIKISSFTYRKIYADEVFLDAVAENSKFNQDYEIVGKPIIHFDGNSITIDVYLKGKADYSEKLEGSFTLKFSAFSKNKFNNKKSDLHRRTYIFRVNKNLTNDFNTKLNEFLSENKINSTDDFIIEPILTSKVNRFINSENVSNSLSSKVIDVPIEIINKIELGIYSKLSKSAIQQDLILDGYDLPDLETFNLICDNAKEKNNKNAVLQSKIEQLFEESVVSEHTKTKIAQTLIISGFEIPDDYEFDRIYNNALNNAIMGVVNNTYDFKISSKSKSKNTKYYLVKYNIELSRFEQVIPFDEAKK